MMSSALLEGRTTTEQVMLEFGVYAAMQVSLDLASFEVVQFCWAALLQVLSEGLLHTVFANEEEAAAVLKAAGSAAPTSNSAPADGAGAQAAAASTDDSSASASATGGNPLQNGGVSSAANGHGAVAARGGLAAERDLLGDEGVAAAQRWLLQYCQVAVVSLGPRGCVARDRHGSAAACVADRRAHVFHCSSEDCGMCMHIPLFGQVGCAALYCVNTARAKA